MTLRPRTLVPFVIVVYFLILIPLVVVIGVSFNPTSSYTFPPAGFSLRWYQAFFATESYVDSFFRVSLTVAFAVALIATVIGMLAATAIVRFRFRGRQALETFFLAPLMTPQILLGAALYLFFARLEFDASPATMALGHLVIATPYVIRTVTAGLVGMDPSLEEAAMSLGASRIYAFLRVTLPLLRSGLLSGAVFAFVISLGDINLALFLSGPNSTTLPVHLFSTIHWGGDPTIAAASTLQIVIVGAAIFFVQKIFRLRLMM
jgi:putative spermidine/putrescine transport system permease protein